MTGDDSNFMEQALRLATEGRYSTSPNPCVGCVIVNQGTVVGEGFHAKAGGPHAEVVALSQAKAKARNATVYVTLEPCSHHGRTPACANALTDAQVRRVVYAAGDPNPQVDGRGARMLRDAGIEVTGGVLAAQAEAQNPGFRQRMSTGRPRIRVKVAMSIDGASALASGESQWTCVV